MRGHEGIVRLRKSRLAPSFVCINDFDCHTDWEQYSCAVATVCVAGDKLADLDFRFLVGLPVTIASESEARAKGLFRLAKSCGASRVIAGHANGSESGWVGFWSEKTGDIYG